MAPLERDKNEAWGGERAMTLLTCSFIGNTVPVCYYLCASILFTWHTWGWMEGIGGREHVESRKMEGGWVGREQHREQWSKGEKVVER